LGEAKFQNRQSSSSENQEYEVGVHHPMNVLILGSSLDLRWIQANGREVRTLALVSVGQNVPGKLGKGLIHGFGNES
jgi:hypothetical protein